MADTPRLPLFVPRREPARRNDEKLSFGSPATLTTIYRPRFQSFQFWPEVNRRKERIPFVLGTPITLTSQKPPRLQPYQFWPEIRKRNWDEKLLSELGTSTSLTSIVSTPRFQPYQFWPEVKLPVVPHQPSEQGSPAPLVYVNRKPQQTFTLRPEIRFPVVDQPTAQGSPDPLLRDKPVGKQTPFQPEIRTPTRPLDKGQLQQGSPSTLTAVTSSQGTGSAAGVGTATGIGNAIDQAVGNAAGTGTATGISAQFAGAGSASGTGTATGVGRVITLTVGSAAGTGTATGVSSAFAGAGLSSGTGTATAVGSSIKPTAGISSGTGTAIGVGRSIVGSIGSSSGTSTAVGVGQSTAGSLGSASGIGTASSVGRAIKTAVGNAAGIGTATAVAASFSGAGHASGIGTATGVGQCIKSAVGNASCIGTASGVIVDVALIPPEEPAQPTSSGLGPPPRRRPIIDIVIQGITLTCHTRILPGRATGISLIPGLPKTSVVVNPVINDYDVRVKFIDPGFPICDEITDEDLISILDRILI